MSGLNKSFDKASREVKDSIEKTIRAAALELFSEIVRRTPVGNPSIWKSPGPAGYIGGALRGNWQASLNAPTLKTIDVKDKSGSATIGKAKNEIYKYKVKDRSIWFSNNLPYADAIESGSHSTQRPNGMVRTTVKQFRAILDRMARRYKK